MVIRALTFLVLILSSHVTLSATFIAEVDRYQITTEEHLTLKLTLKNSDTRLRAQGVSPNIDLSLLTQLFDLGTPRAENRFNIYRNHGRSTSSISVELFPKQPGKLTIPPFLIDGLKTEEIIINVIENQNPAPEVFIKSGLSHSSVWINQQLTAYIDLYHRTELSEAKLGGKLDTEPFISDTIDLPQSERRENSKGFDYNITRLSWAIYPSQSGQQVLYLPDLWIVTKDGRKQRFPVQKQVIEVKPLPASVPKNMIVGSVMLTQTELNNTPSVGQLSSWKVELSSPAQANALPQILGTLSSTPKFKIYRDAPVTIANKTPETLSYTVTYHFSLIPITAGTITLPPIEVPFFNPETGHVEKTVLKGSTIKVAPSSTAAPQITTVPAESHEEPLSSSSPSVWQWLTFIFALLCIIILILWQRERLTHTKKTIHQNVHPEATSSFSPKALLLDALNSQTLEQGLNQWEQHHEIDTEIRDVIRAVQKSSYGKGKAPDDIAIKRAIKKIKKAPVTNTSNISKESFYP